MSDAPPAARTRATEFTRMHAGFLLAAVVLATLIGSAGSIGFARDEGVYFEASRRYAAWYLDGERSPAARDRAFAFNHEHPALLKSVAGLSARALANADDAARGPMTESACLVAMATCWPAAMAAAAFAAPASGLPVASTTMSMGSPTSRELSSTTTRLPVSKAFNARALESHKTISSSDTPALRYASRPARKSQSQTTPTSMLAMD